MANIHIENSYQIRKKDFEKVLLPYYGGTAEEREVMKNRTLPSLKKELAVHNFLYNIGYQRARTKDCDLDYPCDKPEWVYCILGTLVWLFIK